MAPLSVYANSSATNPTLDSCILPGTGPTSPVFSGFLVRCAGPVTVLSLLDALKANHAACTQAAVHVCYGLQRSAAAAACSCRLVAAPNPVGGHGLCRCAFQAILYTLAAQSMRVCRTSVEPRLTCSATPSMACR